MGGEADPGGERHLTVTRAVFTRAYLLEKWALRAKEGVKRKPRDIRQEGG